MFLRSFFFLCLAFGTLSLKFSVSIAPQGNSCFYEVFSSQQKYSVDIDPLYGGRYEFDIKNVVNDQWTLLIYKVTQAPFQTTKVHKLAPQSTIYSFCIRNIQYEPLKVQLNIQSGVELMEFLYLPDENDSENLNNQISWLENQKDTLFEGISRMESVRSTTDGMTNIMSTKMITFAILGLMSVLVVNFILFKELQKTFRSRKLI